MKMTRKKVGKFEKKMVRYLILLNIFKNPNAWGTRIWNFPTNSSKMWTQWGQETKYYVKSCPVRDTH